ncbi:MAG: hypothetical protein GX968_03660 [Tissierellia bacterium]|nr:hypothetical protein [Tissierellia bacterium]
MEDKNNMDIMRNLRTIEWLKAEMLNNIAKLYEILATGEKDLKGETEDLISNIILLSYILGKRLGLSYEDINSNLEDKIKLNLLEDHKIEKWYGDLSELLGFIRRT